MRATSLPSRARPRQQRKLAFARITGCAVSLCLLALPAWAQKTDVIVLDNGDTITGEIKLLELARLELSTDAASTLSIQWEHVVEVRSDKTLEIELRTGEKYYGELRAGASAGFLQVVEGAGSRDVALEDIVRIVPIGESFWNRLDGSFDAGVSFAQASDALQVTLGARLEYRAPGLQLSVDGSSFRQSQEDASTSRNQGTFVLMRSLGRRWFGVALAQGQSNEDLGLGLRALLMGGAGYSVIQSNRTMLAVWLGGGATRERFIGAETTTQAEAVAGFRFRRFVFGDQETDITTQLLVLPSLSTRGRVRLEFETSIRREVVNDLFIGLNIFDTFDSDPQLVGAKENDFGVSASIGWSF